MSNPPRATPDEDWAASIDSMMRLTREYETVAAEKLAAGAKRELPRLCTSMELVRTADCDTLGQFAPGRLVDHFLSMRVVHWSRFYQLDLPALTRKSGQGWVVSEQELLLLRPSRAMDEVVTRTRIAHGGEHEIVVESHLLDGKGRALKAIGRTRYRHIDLKTGVAKPHPEAIAALLAQIAPAGDGDAKVPLAERARVIAAELKGGAP